MCVVIGFLGFLALTFDGEKAVLVQVCSGLLGLIVFVMLCLYIDSVIILVKKGSSWQSARKDKQIIEGSFFILCSLGFAFVLYEKVSRKRQTNGNTDECDPLQP